MMERLNKRKLFGLESKPLVNLLTQARPLGLLPTSYAKFGFPK